MSAKELAHKSAGWAGVALACVTLGTVYLERDTAKHQATQAAAAAQVNVTDAVGEDIKEVEHTLLVTMTLLEEREKTIDRLRERIEELERRHRIRTDHSEPVSSVATLPSIGEPPPPAPNPKALIEDLLQKQRAKHAGKKSKRERYQDAAQQIQREAF